MPSPTSSPTLFSMGFGKPQGFKCNTVVGEGWGTAQWTWRQPWHLGCPAALVLLRLAGSCRRPLPQTPGGNPWGWGRGPGAGSSRKEALWGSWRRGGVDRPVLGWSQQGLGQQPKTALSLECLCPKLGVQAQGEPACPQECGAVGAASTGQAWRPGPRPRPAAP